MAKVFEGCFVSHRRANQSTTGRIELSELDAGLLEDSSARIIHVVALAEYHFFHTDLCDLNATGEAWAGVAVQHGAFSDSFATGFKQSIFFGVQAETGREAATTSTGAVTAVAASFIAIGQVARRAIVPS
jgi:hypothetical protein